MRPLFKVVLAGLVAISIVSTSVASNVMVKGPHICCKSCIVAVDKLLAKVEGVSEVKADAKTKTVTFTAKDNSAAKAGFEALLAGGFFGEATEDGKAIKRNQAYTKEAAQKAGTVTVTKVHACCGQCHSAIKSLFKDARVTIAGSGPQRTVVVEGANVSPMSVLESLQKKGFNGFITK